MHLHHLPACPPNMITDTHSSRADTAVMSLDQFITAVTTLSSQANYAELCDHLNKSQEVA